VVSTGAVAGVVAGGAVVLAAADAVIGRAAGGTSGQSATAATLPTGGTTASTGTTSPPTTAAGGTTPSTSAAEPKGTAIGPAADVPVGGSAAFTDPKSGDPSLVIHPTADRFVAFDAICPHAGCTVAYDPSIRRIACPCHGSQFNAETGAVLQGPATYGLTALKIAEGGDGKLYVAD
jgi:thiosulfate dehydrogenase [quinone] large subunit